MNIENLKLVYVNKIGKNSGDLYEYEFYFSETPEIVWGEDWNVACPSACGDLKPDPSTYSVIKRLDTIIEFSCAQENSCFSLQDSIDHIIAICYESLENAEEYPEPYRIVFQFGEDYNSVETKLASRSQLFKEDIAYGDDGENGNGDDL